MTTKSGSVTVGMTQEVTYVADRARVEDFARASDDYARHHLDDEYATASQLGGPVAHGVLLLGFVSAASSLLLDAVDAHYVTTGYDGVRFKRPVLVGDAVTVHYEVVEADPDEGTSRADFRVCGPTGEVCCRGQHLMKRLANAPD